MMKLASRAVAITIGFAALACGPAAAHHPFAMFDQSKQVELEDMTVTRLQWTNPHAFVLVRQGASQYTLECSSPNLMTHAGWKHNTLKPGDKIGITFYPLRNGRPGGMLKTVTFGNGRKLSAW